MAEQVEGLKIELSAEAKGIVSAIRQTQSEITNLQKTFRQYDKMTKFDATDVIYFNKELGNLTTQLSLQKEQLSQYQTRIQSLNDSISQAETYIKNNEAALGSNSQAILDAKTKLEGLQKVREKEINNAERAQVSYEYTEQTIKNVNNTIAALTGTVEKDSQAFETNISAITANVKSLDKQIGEFEQVARSAFDDDDAVDAYSKEIELLGDKITDLKTLTANYEAQQESLESELKDYKDYLSKVTDEYGENSDEVKEAKNVVSQYETMLKRNEQALESNNNQIKLAESAYYNTSKTLGALQSSTKEYESNLKKLSSKIDDVDTHLGELDRIADTAFDDESKVSAYGEQLKLLDSKLKLLKQSSSEYENINKTLNTELEESVINLSSLTNAYGENSVEVKVALSDIDDLTDRINKNEQAFQTNQNQIKETTNEYKNLETQISEIKNPTTDAADAIENSSDAMDKLNENCDTLNVALGNLIAQGISKAIDKFKELAVSVVETGSGVEEANAELASVLEISKDSGTIKDLSEYFDQLGTASLYSAEQITNNAVTLANAGYEADQIQDSIKAISDLAIGTGESFDDLSNIVVDGLAAFGMSASEATHFTDTLAKAAISTNTDVELMGESFKYVGAVSGQFGYNIEDVGIALGVMSNQGIKASQAGTTLRSIITRLANNTSGAQEAIQNLGVEFYNTDGSARPLIDVLDDVRNAANGLTTEEQAALSYTVAGQRAMTGFAAILNTSQDDWDKLTAEVYDYNGTVEKMVNTRMDTYASDVTLLQNNWKSLSNEMYKAVEPSLRNVIKALSDVMKSPVFQKDIKKLVEGVATAISHLADIITDLGPTSLSTLGTFASMATTFIAVNKSMTGLNSVIKTVSDSFTGVKTVAGAFSGALSGASTATGGLGSAFSILSSNIGPVSIAIAGVAAAIVGLGAYAKSYVDNQQAMIQANAGLTEEMQNTIDKIDALKEAQTEYSTQSITNLEAVNTNSTMMQTLVDKYNALIDANGNVVAGSQNLADMYVGQLAEALGMTTEQVLSYRDANGQLGTAMQDVIEKTQLQATLNAFSEEYEAAILRQIENETYLEQATEQLNEAQQTANEKYSEAQSALNELNAYLEATGQTMDSTDPKVTELKETWKLANAEFGAASGAVNELQGAIDSATQQLSQDTQLTETYNSIVSESYEGTAADAGKALYQISQGHYDYTSMSITELEKLVASTKRSVEAETLARKNGNSTMTDEQYKALQQQAKDQEKAYAQMVKNAEKVAKNTTGGTAKGLRDGNSSLKSASESNANAVKSGYTSSMGIQSPSTVMYGYGQNTAQGAINGMNAQYNALYSAGARMASAVNKGYKNTLSIKSPSRVMMENGKYTVEGIEEGIDNRLSSLTKKVNQMSLSITNGFEKGIDNSLNSISVKLNQMNMQITQALGSGIDESLQSLAARINEMNSLIMKGTSDYLYGYRSSLSNAVNNVNNNNSQYASTYNITINQNDGEDADALARRVAVLIDNDVRRRNAAWQ